MPDTPQQPTQSTPQHRSPLGQAAEEQGIVLAQMLIVADVDRSVGFYRDVLGATVVRERPPAMLRFYNGWIVINTGGGPTPDKPDVSLEPPRDPSVVNGFLNIRVKDIGEIYREWSSRGAQFVTEPLNNHGYELRCYLRDPDGYLIEVGQALPAEGE